LRGVEGDNNETSFLIKRIAFMDFIRRLVSQEQKYKLKAIDKR
jgi:hypothetical protein